MIDKPTFSRPEWAPDESRVTTPASGVQATGFAENEILPSKVNNWFWKRVSSWLNWSVVFAESIRNDADKTINIESESDFNDFQTYLDDLHINDYHITVTGAYMASTGKRLVIDGIYGSGKIIFSDLGLKSLRSEERRVGKECVS